MAPPDRVDVTRLIDACRLGAMQIRVLVVCGCVALRDGWDLQGIGRWAPSIARPEGRLRLVIPVNRVAGGQGDQRGWDMGRWAGAAWASAGLAWAAIRASALLRLAAMRLSRWRCS